MALELDNLRNRKFTAKAVADFVTQKAILLVLLVLVIVTSILQPTFLVIDNLVNILMIGSVYVIIALGEAPALLTKGVDLSAGRAVGLTAVIAASFLQVQDYPTKVFPGLPFMPLLVPIIFAILVGAVVGVVNGTIIAYTKVPPLITTLGTMVIVYGAASLYVDRPPFGALPIGGLRDDFTSISNGAINFTSSIRLPYILIIAAVVVFLMWVLLNKTRLGKNIYAMGANPDAAIVSGVNPKMTLIWVYIIAGSLYGLAGTLQAARQGSATNNLGFTWELDAIASCVIGGVSTNGGVGTIGGVVTGVLIMQVINNALIVLGVSVYWQQIVKGIIIVLAVAIDIRKYARRR